MSLTISQIVDLPVDRRREAIRDWHEATAKRLAMGVGYPGLAVSRPADDVIDGYIDAELMRRRLTGQAEAA
jgi:hypothetical protein